MPESANTRTRILAVIAFMLVAAALRASYSVTMPLAVSALVVAAIWPVKSRLDRSLPPAFSTFIAMLILLALFSAFVAGVYFSVKDAIQVFSRDWPRLDSVMQSFEGPMRQWGFVPGGPQLHERLIGLAKSVLANIYTILVYLGFIALVVLFALQQVPKLRKKLQHRLTAENRRGALDAIDEIASKVRSYLGTMTATSVIAGVACALWSVSTGLDLAIVWGVLNFLLNYIPMIGNFIGIVLPSLYAILQFRTWGMPAIAAGGFLAIQIAISNFLFPVLQGRSVPLSPLAIIVALAAWSFIWGIPGAFVAVPLTAALAMICERFDATRWIADLLSN